MRKIIPLPSQAALCSILDYNPNTGELVWKPGTKFAGRPAGSASGPGGKYKQAVIYGKRLLTHRVIWKMVHAVDPLEIDHINGDPTDNSLANLREVTHGENMRNRALSSNNSSGFHGIYFDKEKQKWRAQITYRMKKIHCGYFHNLDDAVAAKKKYEDEHNFHPNHGREA